MNALVIGKGGREHALCKALVESDSVQEVLALPGSPGFGEAVTCLTGALDPDSIVGLCREHSVDLVIIGPEDPLVAGLASDLREKGLLVFGPGQKPAQLEGSKIFSKNFMEKHSIPTAGFEVVHSVEEVQLHLEKFAPPYVLKADGLAAGKGVFICQTHGDLLEAARALFVEKRFGEAGTQAILEQFQPGYELSYFVLTNGESWVPLPLAQDHKRLLEGGKGPNTGGMGTVAPIEISESLNQQIIEQVIEPTIGGFQRENFDYRGVVFIGLMMTDKGPQVLEYNVRFGDPETQVLMPLLDGDWGEVFKRIAQGELPEMKWQKSSAACVVLAAEGYPESPKKGVRIEGDLLKQESHSYFLHAGTRLEGETWQTNGGRVLNSIGLGDTIDSALQKAYGKLEQVSWANMQFRKDIGSQQKK